MKPLDKNVLAQYGVHLLPTMTKILEAGDYLAMDAGTTLVTSANGGVPSLFTTYVDPEMIRVLVTPMKAAVIAGEQKAGSFETQTAMFKVAESTGEVASYGDYSNNGSARANINYVQRQSYLFQTTTVWGDLESARAGASQVNWVQEQNIASALTLSKYLNKTYFYGVSGLQNYGLLNDPSLPASITPATKAAGGATWANGTGFEVYNDVLALYQKLVAQTAGLVDRDTPMVLALAPEIEVYLLKTNNVFNNIVVRDLVLGNFRNLRIETAKEYATAGGQLIQLIAEKIDGIDTVSTAFNEKMRMHGIVRDLSSYRQKQTSGTWGSIVKRPLAIASMLGA
jgi:hypothetical protein